MKRKERDLILQAAFDELRAGERLRVERLLDAQEAAREELESMKAIRSGLRELRNAPDCQLSIEHVRNAILNQGVQSQGWRSAWRWTVPSVAVAAIALVLVSHQRLDTPSARSIISPEAPAPVAFNNADKSAPVETASQPFDIVVATCPPDDPPEAGVRHAMTRVVENPSGKAVGLAESANPFKVHAAPFYRAVNNAGSRLGTTRGGSSFDLNMGGPTTTATAANGSASSYSDAMSAGSPRKAGSKDSVVVVTSVESEDTGAQAATEVMKPDHVVFGG